MIGRQEERSNNEGGMRRIEMKNRGRTKNARALVGRLNAGWAIGRFSLQICTKKNAGSDSEECEEEEVLKW